MSFLICILGALIWGAILLLAGELVAWIFSWVFGPVPMRVRQLYTAIVALIFVIAALSCLAGIGPMFPMPWQMPYRGH